MYLSSDRLFYFAGENVVQDFNNPTQTPGLRASTKDYLNESRDASFYSKPATLKEPEQNKGEAIKKKVVPKHEDIYNSHNDPPRDLGEQFVRVLLDEFKRVRQISTKDPKVLLEFWRQNRKLRQKEAENLNKSRVNAKNNQSFHSQASQTSERIRELQNIAKEREVDVEYTLQIQSEILQQEENMKKYILDAYRQKKMEESIKQAQKPKKMSEEVLNRLYKAPPPKEKPEDEGRPSTQKTDERKTYDKIFMKKLSDMYADSRPTERRNVDQDRLFSFWQGLSNKNEYKLDKKESVVKEDLELYFDEKYDRIEDLYIAKYGFRTYETKSLLTFYKNEISEEEKKRREIDFDPLYLEKPLDRYCAKRKKEHEEYQRKHAEEMRQREEQERSRLSKMVIRKEIKATGLENLAKPKDNLKRGKTMIFLKKVFPHDKILQKMIINEFKKNKLLKYPEEYDVYDSEDEMDTYQRDELREPFRTVRKEGRALKISDLSKPLNMREKEIMEPFQKYLEQRYLDSNLKLEEEKQKADKEQKEDKKLNRFIAVKVRGYLQMRKRRLYEKIPTLKKFLIQTYQEMQTQYKESTERRFPHITYGYSKRLKANSYPVEFKRYFFILVRAISRGTKMSQGKNLLPFWAPPSAGAKAYNALNTNISYNKRVNELSKETKIKKIEDQTEKKTCWQKDEFYTARLNMMMRLSDAKECTFTPNVGSKMPKEYKELMLQEYAAWANQFLTSTKSSFDEWVNAMGDNLSKRFPTIYKYGKFKRALRFWKEEQYVKAYKEIAEAFHIDDIKKHFDPTFRPNSIHNRSTLYSKENLKVNEETYIPSENFNDAPNARFLEDVYILIMFLESHEKDLKKSVKEVEDMLNQDRMRFRSKVTKSKSKTMMCPLGDQCSEDIRPRWPNTNTKTISKFGQKCEYAHHLFELKFEQEIKAKKKMLNNTLNELNKKLQSDYVKPAFNPGGGVFTDCIGCGEELRTKGISKGVCSSCQLKKGVSKKLEAYRQKAATKYLKITRQDSFLNQYHEKHDFEERLNLKMGYYRKACILYENERYKDAFKNIAKAVEMVKNEKRLEEDKEQKRAHDLKVKLGIDPSIPLTMDMIYDFEKSDNLAETGGSLESINGLTKAKVRAFAEKMGYIGEQKVDVNEFLNYQIQEMYIKIEKALQVKIQDIDRLQKKIEKLEGFDEEVEEVHAEQNTIGMNESLSAKRRRQQSLRPKHKFDIDMVPVEKKIDNMQKTIQYIKNEMERGEPPHAWKPTKHDNIILDIEKYDAMMSEKNFKKAPGEKSKELSSTLNPNDKSKSIYARDIDDLLKMPYEKSSPMKY